jgi:twinkle protein
MRATATFADFGIDAPEHGTGEYQTTCPQCSASRKKKSAKCLSVNLADGTWCCHHPHCGWTGHLGSASTDTLPAPVSTDTPRPVAAPTRELTDEALAFLKSRGISRQTAELAGVRSAVAYFHDLGDAPALAFVYTVAGAERGIKYRATCGKAFTQTKGGCKTAYLHDLAAGSSQVVITEGELDALALLECGVQGVVSCPEGAPPIRAKADGKLAFLEASGEVFKGAERVVLAMDQDEPGIHWRELLAAALGPERCLVVTWPEGCKDGNDALLHGGKDAVLLALRTAKLYPCPGLHEPADYANDVVARLTGPDTRGLSTGYRNLDALYRIEPGSLTVVTGIPGSGKSELLDCLAINTAHLHGWRWAIFSPENYPLARHMAKLVEKMEGRPFKSIEPDTVRKALAYMQERFVFLSEDDRGMSIDRLAILLKTAAARYAIRGAIVDPWNEIEHNRSREVNESEYIGGALTLLRNVARREGFALFVSAHPTKLEKQKDSDYGVPTPYDISGSANWRNKADACLTVWRSMAHPDATVDVHVQKIRFRETGQLGKCRLYWRKDTGTYGDYREGGTAPNISEEDVTWVTGAHPQPEPRP